MLQNDKSPDAPGRLDNLQELIRAMEPFENLDGFLEHVALATDTDEAAEDDKINVMTLHAAKGLEFRSVFLPGWEEGLFPHQRALDESGMAGLEEERRLAYVGLTRARERAYIFSAANRRVYNQWQSSLPSRFIDELPEDHIDRQAQQGLFQGFQVNQDRPSTEFQDFYDEPAWQPRFRRPARRATTIDGQATRRRVEEPQTTDFAIGERVFHDKFGYGTITDTDGNKLEIEFEKAGTKRVIDSFVRRAP
jgi:DNA helicase-2/ATP-dependent DNA helicase PcrA